LNPGAQFMEIKKNLIGSLKYSGDDADLDAQYLGYGLVWALLPGVVAEATVSYSAPTSCTQKPKLMRKGGHFIYSLALPLTCSSHRA
jgi:hypothetical protein